MYPPKKTEHPPGKNLTSHTLENLEHPSWQETQLTLNNFNPLRKP